MARIVLISGLVVLISGCGGTARLVRKEKGGGTLALVGARKDALEDARAQMQAHCGGGYEIVAEEEVPVGLQSDTRAMVDDSVRTNTQVVRERHISYQCAPGAGLPAASLEGGGAAMPNPQLAPGRGAVVVQTEGEGAEVWLDGKSTGQVTPAQLVNLAPGGHEIEVRTATRVGSASVDVFPAVVTPVRIRPQAPRSIAVTIETDPAGGLLELDGAAVGTTPHVAQKIEAGQHRVRITHADRSPLEEDVFLTAAQPTMRLRLPALPANQVRFFPASFVLEYARNFGGPSWLGLQLTVAAALAMGAPGISTDAGAAFVYRYQGRLGGDLGFGAMVGVGSGAVANAGHNWVGIYALGGASVRYEWAEFELAAQYLTPVTFNGNDDPGLIQAPLVLRPELHFVFAF